MDIADRARLGDHGLGGPEIRLGHRRDGEAEEPGLELRPDLEQLLDLVRRERGHDRALVHLGRDEPLGFELADGLPQRDAGDAELGGELLLTKRGRCRQFAGDDAAAQLADDLVGQGLASDPHRLNTIYNSCGRSQAQNDQRHMPAIWSNLRVELGTKHAAYAYCIQKRSGHAPSGQDAPSSRAAGAGIGEATARLFARGGRAGRGRRSRRRAAEAVAASLGDASQAFCGRRLASRRRRRPWSRYAAEQFGRLDILVNNAGYGIGARVVTTEEEDWDALMAVNLKGVYLCCKHAIPVMRAQGGGAIVNTASTRRRVGIPDRAAYVASKGGGRRR